jgi:hypothetical protein
MDEDDIIEATAVVSEETNEFWVPEDEQELWVVNEQSLGEFESNELASEESWDHSSVEVADDVGGEVEEPNATKSTLWNEAQSDTLLAAGREWGEAPGFMDKAEEEIKEADSVS